MRILAAALVLASSSPALASADYGKTEGVVPGVLFGPHLNLIALPPGFGLEARTLSNRLGLSLDYGFVPTVTVEEAKASWNDLSLGARFYPWAGRFYLGARVGTRSFEASAKDDTSPGAALEAKAKVKSTYLAPELGWRFAWQSGFFLGIELGWQLILSSKTTLDIPVTTDPQTRDDVIDAADVVGDTGLPVLTLVQLGWYF
jgi:hypothetical protein